MRKVCLHRPFRKKPKGKSKVVFFFSCVSTKALPAANMPWRRVKSFKSFHHLWGNLYTKFVALDVKSQFTCGESSLYQNIVVFHNIISLIVAIFLGILMKLLKVFVSVFFLKEKEPVHCFTKYFTKMAKYDHLQLLHEKIPILIHFRAIISPFLYQLKIWENLHFSHVFIGYKKRTLALDE